MMAGQTINDRFLAARHSLAGQGLAKSVCKATTEELIGPKKKHLDYLVQCTNEPNVSIPQLANLLIERSQSANWIVVYKALVTVHHLMCFGNERFTQYLASSNSTFQLHNFFDKSGVQGYDMSPFIRRYSKYLNEKAKSYRIVAFDFCKTKRGKEDGTMRTMNAERLIKTVPTLQCQLDALLEFDCSPNDLNNGVINMCFMLLFKDLIRLFASYNDGIINLLEKFFDMNKKQCKEALDIYKKFLVRMDKVADFLKVAENIGIDKGDIPDLTKAPSSLLDALEQHLASLEGKKSSTSSTPSTQSVGSTFAHPSASSTTSVATATATASTANDRLATEANGIDESLKQKVLAEEEAAINQFKNKVQSTPGNNPFLKNATQNSSKSANVARHHQQQQQQQQHQQHVVDFFSPEPQQQPTVKASEDLLQLNNPFADVFLQSGGHLNNNNAWLANNNSTNGYPTATHMQNVLAMGGSGGGLMMSGNSTNVPANGIFVSESNFQTVFGNAEDRATTTTTTPSSNGFDSLGGVLQPSRNNNDGGKTTATNNNDINQHQSSITTVSSSSALLTGDLETSLASLAENLSINRTAQPTKGIQWTSPKNGSKPSGGLGLLGGNATSAANNNNINSQNNGTWNPQPMAATTGAGYKPMNQSMMGNHHHVAFNQPLIMQTQMYHHNNPHVQLQPMMMSIRQMPPVANNGLSSAMPVSSGLIGHQQQQQQQQQSLLFH